MNAPWGVVWTTRDFGEFANSILVGNFRSGWIAAFNGFTHKFIGFVKNPDNSLMFIDGVWSLTFGNDGTAGPSNTLFFSAGINNELDGSFGTITPTDGLDGDERINSKRSSVCFLAWIIDFQFRVHASRPGGDRSILGREYEMSGFARFQKKIRGAAVEHNAGWRGDCARLESRRRDIDNSIAIDGDDLAQCRRTGWMCRSCC